MFWLGLLMPVVYVPAWTGAMVITGWVALSCILPFFFLRKIEMDWTWSLGLAFLFYATLSLAWAPIWQQAIWDLWLTYVLAGCFLLGATRDPRALWVGMAVALSIADVIALFQRMGYHPLFASDSWYQAGNFVNPDMFGETAALVSVALISFADMVAPAANAAPDLLHPIAYCLYRLRYGSSLRPLGSLALACSAPLPSSCAWRWRLCHLALSKLHPRTSCNLGRHSRWHHPPWPRCWLVLYALPRVCSTHRYDAYPTRGPA